MKQTALFSLIVLLCVVPSGCQSVRDKMPWKKKSPPPVEILDETKQQMETTPSTGTTAPVDPNAGLRLSGEQRFRDVPLPVNVKEDLQRSYVYESEDLQIGRLVYTSRASIVELAQFYIRECPAAGWKLEKVLEVEGSKQLTFTKPGKHLEVHVQSQGIGRANVLILMLSPSKD